MTLFDGCSGAAYEVEAIRLATDVERRLEILGVIEGTAIEILNKKNNGAVIFKVRGARFAVGREIARGILVRRRRG